MSRIKPTYIATIWSRDPENPRQWIRSSPSFVLGSNLRHARDRARDLLPIKSIETTRWNVSRDLSRVPFMMLTRRDQRGRPEIIEPDVWIVPSVGELGWTP